MYHFAANLLLFRFLIILPFKFNSVLTNCSTLS